MLDRPTLVDDKQSTNGFHLGGTYLGVFSRKKPGPPESYPEHLDGIILETLETLIGDGNMERTAAYVRHVLQNYPVARFLNVLARKSEVGLALARHLVPMTASKVNSYAAAVAPYDVASPLEGMSDSNAFLFAMLTAKDAFTAEHCVDVQMMTDSVGWALSQEIPEFSSYGLYRPDVRLAAVNHDLGKAEMASIALLAPFHRDRHMPLLFRANLISEQRKRPITGLERVLNAEELEEFAGLLGPRRGKATPSSDMVDRLMNILLSRHFNFQNIPLRFLMNTMRDMKPDGSFPSELEGLENERLEEKFLPLLAEHKEALEHLEAICDMYGYDAWEMTFRDLIDMHESSTVELLRGHVHDRVRDIAGRHHRYPLTSRRLGAAWGQLGDLSVPCEVVAASDVISAVAQMRAYAGAQGRNAAQVAGIMGQELRGKGLAREDAIRILTPLITEGDAPAGQVMSMLHRNVVRQYGVPSWNVSS